MRLRVLLRIEASCGTLPRTIALSGSDARVRRVCLHMRVGMRSVSMCPSSRRGVWGLDRGVEGFGATRVAELLRWLLSCFVVRGVRVFVGSCDKYRMVVSS